MARGGRGGEDARERRRREGEDPPQQWTTLGQLRAIGTFVRPYRKWLVVAFIATSLGGLLGLAFPWVMGNLVDSAFATGDSTDALDRAVLILLAVSAGQAITSYARIHALSYAGQHAVNDLRAALFDRILHLPIPFFDAQASGVLTSRLLSDAAVVYGSASGAAPQAVYSGITTVGGTILLFVISPTLALVVVALLPMAALVARHYGRRIRSVSRGYQHGLASTNALATESITSIRAIKWFTAESSIVGRYEDRLTSVVDKGMSRARVRSVWTPAMTFFTWVGVVAVIWFGGRQVQADRLTAGALVSFLLYARVVGTGISTLVTQYSRLAQSLGATERVFSLLDEVQESEVVDPARIDPDRVVRVSDRTGRIRLEQVSFTYPTREGEVLRDVNLDIPSGETVALVGASGSGKSTLTQLISRFYDPDAGSVYVDGVDVRLQDLTELRKSIAIVPQEVLLLSGSVAENIRLGRPDASRAEMKAAGRAANAHDFITAFPKGYGTRVGERGMALSGGQRQRIAIARALLADPRLLILDEATNALDVETEALVREALDPILRARDPSRGRLTFVSLAGARRSRYSSAVLVGPSPAA